MDKTPSLTIVEDEDLGITVSAPGEKGDNTNPIDGITGEPMFDDIDPFFSRKTAESRKKVEVGDEDDFEEEEPEEEETVEEEAEEEETEEEPRKSGVQKRIGRERRLREEAESNYRDLKSEVDDLRAQINVRASDEEFGAKKSKFEADIAGLNVELTTAIEEGDSKKQVAIQNKLAEAHGELIAARTLHAGAKAAAEKQGTAAKSIVQRKVSQWIRKHPRFNSDAEFGEIARVIDKQVARDGFDPETDEFYGEVDKRLAARFPDEYKGQKKLPDEARRNRPPSQGFRREPSGKRTGKVGNFEVRGGKVRLSPRQVSNMRTFGLDPTSESDVREYIGNNTPARAR